VSRIVEAIATFFERHEWPVQQLDADHLDDETVPGDISVTSVRGEHGTWPLVVGVVGDGPAYLVVQSIVPPVAPQGDEVAVLELITRLNDGLVAGCWELNFDDGTIRLRSSVPVSALAEVGTDVLVDLIDDLVTGNVIAADRFIPALEATIEHRLAPAIAIAAVEAGLDPREQGNPS
jgi:hypothetical protein